jgi:RNase P/RNase MRP subunit p30
MIEYGKFDMIAGIEFGERKNSLKQADSGVNHYLAKTAEKNKVALGIDISQTRELNIKERAEVIERLIQNIKICRKANCKIKLLNYKDEKNAFYFLISLGASSEQAKKALAF